MRKTGTPTDKRCHRRKNNIENDHYVLYAKNKAKGITEKYSIPVETVDQIFNDFSKH